MLALLEPRLMCSTYLTFFMRDELLDEMPLYPYPDALPQGANGDPSAEIFMAPSVTYSYDQARANQKAKPSYGSEIPLYAHPESHLTLPVSCWSNH